MPFFDITGEEGIPLKLKVHFFFIYDNKIANEKNQSLDNDFLCLPFPKTKSVFIPKTTAMHVDLVVHKQMTKLEL